MEHPKALPAAVSSAPGLPPGFPAIAPGIAPRFSIAPLLPLDCPRRKQRGFMVSVSVVKVK